MKELTIKIPELGKRRGTLAWVADQLESANKSLTLAGEVPSVKALGFPIAWVDKDDEVEDDPFVQRKDVVRFIYPENTDRQNGLFDCPLTPAAEEKVQEFLEEVASQLLSRWENS